MAAKTSSQGALCVRAQTERERALKKETGTQSDPPLSLSLPLSLSPSLPLGTEPFFNEEKAFEFAARRLQRGVMAGYVRGCLQE